MICLELRFDETNKFDVEYFLTRHRIMYFEKSCENNGCIKLFVAEKEYNKIESLLKRCRHINNVKNINILQEIL